MYEKKTTYVGMCTRRQNRIRGKQRKRSKAQRNGVSRDENDRNPMSA